MTPLSRRIRHLLILIVTLTIPMAAWVGVAQRAFGHSCPDVAKSNTDPGFPGGCIGWDNWVMCAEQDETNCAGTTMIYGTPGYWWTKPQTGMQVWEDWESMQKACWGTTACEWTGNQCLSVTETANEDEPEMQRAQYNDTTC